MSEMNAPRRGRCGVGQIGLAALLVVASLTGCSARDLGGAAFERAAVATSDDDEGGGPPILVQVLMWAPNRVLDALEMVRFGVGVGPGIGVDVRVTEFAQASAMTGSGVGVGWQGRFSSPVLVDTWAFVAAGPVTLGSTGVDPLLAWRRTFWEIRAGAHVALVFANAVVDLAEIHDFLLGILFFDPMHDDILGPYWI